MSQQNSKPNSHDDAQLRAQLEQLRQAIDSVDAQLIDLLAERSRCIQKIAQLKCENHLPLYDNAREVCIIEKVTEENVSHYQAVDMANIFNAILRAGLNQQLLFRAEFEA